MTVLNNFIVRSEAVRFHRHIQHKALLKRQYVIGRTLSPLSQKDLEKAIVALLRGIDSGAGRSRLAALIADAVWGKVLADGILTDADLEQAAIENANRGAMLLHEITKFFDLTKDKTTVVKETKTGSVIISDILTTRIKPGCDLFLGIDASSKDHRLSIGREPEPFDPVTGRNASGESVFLDDDIDASTAGPVVVDMVNRAQRQQYHINPSLIALQRVTNTLVSNSKRLDSRLKDVAQKAAKRHPEVARVCPARTHKANGDPLLTNVEIGLAFMVFGHSVFPQVRADGRGRIYPISSLNHYVAGISSCLVQDTHSAIDTLTKHVKKRGG